MDMVNRSTDIPHNPAIEGELLGAPEPSTPTAWLEKQQLARLISIWTDTVFEVPVLGWRFGLDPLIGLIPIAGDVASSVVSLYILALAAEMQVPRSTMLRMGLNVAIDYFVGSIPLVGNVFDFAWKANSRNMQLLERSLAAQPAERRRQSVWDWVILLSLVAVLIAILIASIAMTVTVIGWMAKAMWH
jgi:uncharacterized protein DUF4112